MSDEGLSAPTGINWSGHVGTVQYGGGNMVVMFYTKAMPNKAKSLEQGRPIFEDTVMVRIHPPGERLNIVDRPATQTDKSKYAIQWMQFSQNKQQVPDGTPVDLLYPDHPSIGAMLRASGVYTVEQCAELSGPAIDAIGMGAQRYTNDAQKYLQASNKGVKASQLRHELEERDSQIRTLSQTVETLQGEITRLREQATANVSLVEVQKLIAGQQARPTYPAGAPKQMSPTFDPQTAQINATHATAEVARAAKKPPRSRMRIGEAS